MRLSDIFSVVAYKRLVNVDISPEKSHQHEINGSKALRDFFGTETVTNGGITWAYFSDDQPIENETGEYTFYNARKRDPKRTEWRLYYTGDFPVKYAQEGDVLLLLRGEETVRIYGLIIEQNSSWMSAIKYLFDFGLENVTQQLQLIPSEILSRQQLEFVEKMIIDSLGIIDVPEPDIDYDEEIVVRHFGTEKVPSTEDLAKLARDLCENWDPEEPDQILVNWLDRETKLFYAVEIVIYGPAIKKGFETIEDFVRFSNSFLNSRKSRRGRSLELHLKYLFTRCKIRFSHGAFTEGKSKPDFLFPGVEYYHNKSFDTSLLNMLAAKSTCKDRWRQILVEAAKIPVKHLCTLETSISIAQTNEMKNNNVVLVVPKNFRDSYFPDQQKEILTVKEFIQMIKSKQKGLK